jgi:hypothetical protein
MSVATKVLRVDLKIEYKCPGGVMAAAMNLTFNKCFCLFFIKNGELKNENM